MENTIKALGFPGEVKVATKDEITSVFRCIAENGFTREDFSVTKSGFWEFYSNTAGNVFIAYYCIERLHFGMPDANIFVVCESENKARGIISRISE